MARNKKRTDGRYRYKLSVGKDSSGRPVTKYFYGATDAEAKSRAAEYKAALDKGIDLTAGRQTFAYWAEQLLRAKKMDVGKSQYLNLENFNRHLEAVSALPIEKINAAALQAVIMDLAQWHNGQPPLSKRTLTGIKQFAHQVFLLAIKNRAIDYNPAAFIDIPQTATVTHREPITAEQIQWICDTPHKAQRAAMVMLYSGLRKGEVMALDWTDIDLAAGTISVCKSMEYVSGAKNIKAPKTEAGNRTVVIPQKLAAFLTEQRRTDEAAGIFSRNRPPYFLRDHAGERMSESGFRRMWDSYMLDLNVKYGYDSRVNKFAVREKSKDGSERGALPMVIETFTCHQLRHTYATLLHNAGIDAVTARDQLGHADIQTTLGIYTHLDTLQRQKDMAKLDKMLEGVSNGVK